MGRTSTISSKGQITLPLEIRNRMGLGEGDRVEFVVEDGIAILRPALSAANPFEKYVGALPSFASRRDINRWMRGLRDADDDIQ